MPPMRLTRTGVVSTLRAALACPTCGKSTLVANIAGQRQGFRAEPVSPERHCACVGGPAYVVTHNTDTCRCNDDPFGNGPCARCREVFEHRRLIALPGGR